MSRPVVGIGLNKTGTKTLRHCLNEWGYRTFTAHEQAFNRYLAGDVDGVLDSMEGYDAFEDWPWPLVFREIDERFPAAKFVLTVRRDASTWFRSLCKMAVRMGPLRTYEQPIYGFSMPQGHRAEHIAFYERHNAAVREHFRDRPDKLLEICWEADDSADALAAFLGEPSLLSAVPTVNRSARVYGGERLVLAHLSRLVFRSTRRVRRAVRRVVGITRRS